jgi:CubicO group peptidase (beta-lactamase class C family)
MTNVVYGNFDYLMLSQVIAKLAGAASFEQALNTLVLAPLKMTRTRGSRSLTAAQASDEAHHHLRVYDAESSWPLFPLQISPSVKDAAKPAVPAQYGAWDYELFDGCGGLSSAVVDVARLAAMFSDRIGNPVLSAATIDSLFNAAAQASKFLTGPNPKGVHGFHGFDSAAIDDADDHVYRGKKGGWLPGQGTSVVFSTGGFGFALAQNGNRAAGVETAWYEPVVAAAKAQSWSDKDLFPDFGMPSLAPARLSQIALSAAVLAKLSPRDVEDQVRDSVSVAFAQARRPLLPRPSRPVVRGS